MAFLFVVELMTVRPPSESGTFYSKKCSPVLVGMALTSRCRIELWRFLIKPVFGVQAFKTCLRVDMTFFMLALVGSIISRALIANLYSAKEKKAPDWIQ